MKGHHIVEPIQVIDNFSLFVTVRVTVGNQYRCYGGLRRYLHRYLVQFPVGSCHQQVNQIGLNSGQNYFCLGVAHAGVVLNDDGFTFHVHQPNK